MPKVEGKKVILETEQEAEAYGNAGGARSVDANTQLNISLIYGSEATANAVAQEIAKKTTTPNS